MEAFHSRRTYDYRIQEAICETGDRDLFPELNIPRSTIRSWILRLTYPLATGFHVDAFMRPMDIRRRDGVLLDDVWKERPSACLAVGVSGFPNLLMLDGPNIPVGNFSLIQTAEIQLACIMQLVDAVADGWLAAVEPTREAARRFEDERTEAAKKTVWATGCRSWYLDDRGIPSAWPFSFERFRKEMRAPQFEDYRAA